MVARLTHSSVQGFESVQIENDRVRAVILPRLGGRVWSLEDLARDRQWIWHRPDVPLRECAVGSDYDDEWAGGWEELFPNDAAGVCQGRDLPDHGEWWATPWTVEEERDGDVAVVRMSAELSVVRVGCTKEFRLAKDGSQLIVSYRIRSLEAQPFNFLFKQHLPVELSPGCRLALPRGRAEAVDPAFGTMIGARPPFDWPVSRNASGDVDMRVIPDRPGDQREFLYVRDLPRPWCGVDDVPRDAAIRMTYDAGHFPYVWLFLSYGGWRNVHTAVLEPCTNLPKDLAEATRLGQAALLNPGEEFATEVRVTLSDVRTARANDAT
jgi:hypothetical protein